MTTPQTDRVVAAPTKAFFIEMLVKDIQLVPAIVDLVDNSVDGARRLRGTDASFDGLSVRLVVRPDLFEIEDNCGGIPLDTARNYAFRFGRPEGFPVVQHSVGQFGVGMKRALFKLGGHFIVRSVTDAHRFAIEVDVETWRKNDDDWHFDWSSVEELAKAPPVDEQGTQIVVSKLHDSVSEDFDLKSFSDSLYGAISAKHQIPMSNGLAILLNGIPIDFGFASFLTTRDMAPAHVSFDLRPKSKSGASVLVSIYAGLGVSSPPDAGWYIYCNGRQVVGANQTDLTGWGGKGGVAIPKFHNQYARFRGYVFFDADDASLLPWNTTKTGVDEDSDVYRTVKSKMVELMRPVIDFLNKLDQEKDQVGVDDVGPLEDAVVKAAEKPIHLIVESASFTPPKAKKVVKRPKTGRIQYDRHVDVINRVKKALGVRTYKDVGEQTFDYFVDLEGLDE